MTFEPNHRYAQQATKLTQWLFIITSILTIAFVVMAFAISLWWLAGIVLIVVFWGVYSSQMKTVPVRDLNTRTTGTVNTADWRAFKEAHPTQVAKNGAKS